MYNPQEGEIYFDELPASKIDLHLLRSSFSYVPQDVLLFSDTIRNNISFGNEKVKIESLDEAVKHACLQKEIDNMKDGLETIVGEKGVTLSGGQKQRVSIARAILREESKIALFDDCLSAVDAETEHILFNNLTSFLKQRTSILITHRLFNLTNYQRIIVLDEGKLVEEGSHIQLMEKKGKYYQLFLQQQNQQKAL